MLPKLLTCSLLLVTLACLPGCIIHDPGYYHTPRAYYFEPYYYGPYFYTPFWLGGYYIFEARGRGHHFHQHRGHDRHGGGRGHR